MAKNSEEQANKNAAEDLKDAVEGEESEEEDKPEKVVLEDPEEAEEEPVRGQAKRAQRASRHRELEERASAAERERDDMRVRLIAIEEARRATPQAREEPREDPLDSEIKKTKAAMDELQDDYARLDATKVDQDTIKRYRDKYNEYQSRISELSGERAVRRVQPNGGPDPYVAAEIANLRTRYHDVVSHPDSERLLAYANGKWQAERARLPRGTVPGVDVMDRVMDETRRIFGLSKSPPPSDATRARFSGGSSGARGVENSAGPREFTMTAADKKMARAMSPGLPDKQAFQRYAQVQLRKSS